MIVDNHDLMQNGPRLFTRPCFDDGRGRFEELWSENRLRQEELPMRWLQANVSVSHKGVLRGLHFQTKRHAQAKLVSCVFGKVLDVIVDMRPGPRQWKHAAVFLGPGTSLFVPAGFAHGFLTLEAAVIHYLVDKPYCKAAEGGLRWDDPTLAIEWFSESDAICVNERDRNWPLIGREGSG